MARRTPFYAHLVNIAAGGASCPSGSSMVAGKCTPTPVSPSESKTISLTKTPTRLGSSIQSTKVTIGTRVPEKIKTPVVATGSSAFSTTSAGKAITTPTISLARPEERSTPNSGNPNKHIPVPEERSTPNSGNPNKHIPVTEKKPITLSGGISASSISSTPTTFQKAVSTPTIAIQKPETVVLGGISISPASGVTTSIKRTVAVHEEQSIPASEIPSVSPTGESPGYIFRGIPIKM